MILKILLVAGVVFVVYALFFKKKAVRNDSIDSQPKRKEKREANDMVECSTCGVYCELKEAIISDAKYYCSQECVKKAS
jgi:uncharacterized protein